MKCNLGSYKINYFLPKRASEANKQRGDHPEPTTDVGRLG